MWARQLAWLHAKPGKDDKTRQERFQAMGITPTLPDVGHGQYILDAFLKMKIASHLMGEIQPRSWEEVLAFAKATHAVSQPWELQALFDMSWDYVNELNKATNPFLKSPMERKQNG